MTKNHCTRFDKIVYVLFASLFIIDFFSVFSFQKDLFVQLSFFIIGAISYFMFAKEEKFISIFRLVHVFMFLFCYLAPMHQYISNTEYWDMGPLYDSHYLKANILILIFYISIIFISKMIKNKSIIKFKESKITMNSLSTLISTLLSVVCMVLLYISGELFSTSGGTSNSSIDGSFQSLIFKILRFYPVSVVLLLVFIKRNNKLNLRTDIFYFYLVLNLLLSLIIYNPLAGTISRYLLLGTYIMVFLALFPNIKNKSILLIILFVGFYFIFPTMNYFKNNSFSDFNSLEFLKMDLTSSDYDAYYMFAKSIEYVDTNSCWLGKNLITGILSFVPRSIWATKLAPSGEIMADHFNAFFTNVSCPIFAEFYLAFDIYGFLFLSLAFGYLLKTLEKYVDSNNYILKGISFIFVGLIIILLRGSLLPISSFIFSLAIAYLIQLTLLRLLCELH